MQARRETLTKGKAMTIIELLDQTKERLQVKSDYALAKALQINQARLSAYRKGKENPDPYALTKIALALDLDPLALIAEFEARTEKNATRKGFWENFLRRVGSGLGVVALCCMAAFGSANGTNAGSAFFRPRKFA